jgi:hypothetical protein
MRMLHDSYAVSDHVCDLMMPQSPSISALEADDA